MDKMARVHELHTLKHLVRDHEHGFEGEATAAFVELIFQTGSEEVHHHEVVGVLGPEVVDLGEAGRILELTVYFVLVAELRAAGAMLFEFYGNLFASWGRKNWGEQSAV